MLFTHYLWLKAAHMVSVQAHGSDCLSVGFLICLPHLSQLPYSKPEDWTLPRVALCESGLFWPLEKEMIEKWHQSVSCPTDTVLNKVAR